MRKSLSMLLAIAMVFSMFSSLAFAADPTPAPATAKEKYDFLAAKGIFAGMADGSDGLDQAMNRAQFARVAALILGLEGISADLEAGDSKVVTVKPFSDVELGLWYTEEIAAVKEAKAFVGNTDGTFNPTGNINIQELAVVVATLLELEPVENAEITGAAPWAAGYIKAIQDAGLEFPTNYKEDALRADLATLAYTAYLAVEAGKVPPVPATLEVTSVSSTNLKTFAVVFNQAVDKDTVTNNGTVKVTDVPSTVKLSDDAKTAYVILTAAALQSTELEFVVNGVKTKDAKEIKDYKVKVLAIDSTVPVVTGATFINHKEIELQFSEPVNFVKTYYEGLSNIKIDGTTVTAKTTVDDVKNTVRLQFPTLLKNGTVKLEVSDIADYAGYKIAKAEFDVLVVEDTTAPVLASAEVKNLTTVEVTFNERIETTGTFKVNGETATATSVTDSNGTKFSLALATGKTLDLGATVEIKVAYKGQKDVAGNEVKDEVTFSFKVSDDTTLPTVSVLVEKENKITLTFSKAMQKVGTIKVQNKDKKDLNTYQVSNFADSKWTKNYTVLTLAAADLALPAADPTTYFLVLKDMKDSTVRTNLLPEQTIQIAAVDTKKPGVASKYVVTNGSAAADDTISFFFTEAVNVDTAKNLSNYIIEAGTGPVGYTGGPLSGYTKASFKSISSDSKTVVIKLEDARSLPAGTEFTVYAIKDIADIMMDSTSDIGKYTAATISVLSATATAKNKIEVLFSGADIGSADPSALAVFQGADVKTQFVTAEKHATNPHIVVFTTASDIGAATAAYSLKITNYNAVKSVFGDVITPVVGNEPITAGNLVDKIGPTVKESKRAEALVDYDKFIITFDEDLKALSLVDTSVIVRDKDNNLLARTVTQGTGADANKLTIEVTATYTGIINVTLEKAAVTDTQTTGNVSAYAAITSTDNIIN